MPARKDKLPMDSESARQRIQLYLYDELGVQERHEIERACEEDPDYRALFEDEKSFLSDMDTCKPEASSETLLAECRHDLMREIYREEIGRGNTPVVQEPGGWRQELQARLGRLVRQPAPAMACIALGFLFGQWDMFPPQGSEEVSLTSSLSGSAEIQSVQADPESGQIRIVLDERKIVSGTAGDPAIRRLLLDTIRESHSGARLASLEVLRRETGHREVRRELLRLMLEDENPGVRLKALDVVRLRSDEPETQQALVQAVLSDPNPGMRVQAIQILTAEPKRELVGAFQHIVEQEHDEFVQQQCVRALQYLDASVEYH